GVDDAVDVADEGVARVAGRTAAAAVELEPVGKFGVEHFPGRPAEVAFDAHEFRGTGGSLDLLLQGLVGRLEQGTVEHSAHVERGGQHDVAGDLDPLFLVHGQSGLSQHGLAGGGGVRGGERSRVVAVVAEQVHVDVVLVEQAHHGGVDVDGFAGDEVADVGDGDVHGVAVLALDDQGLVFAADAATGGQPVGAGGGGHRQSLQQ